MQYFWLFCDINYCCGRNRDREIFCAYVVKEFIIQMGVVDYEARNFLVTGFYRQGLESILIDNSPLG